MLKIQHPYQGLISHLSWELHREFLSQGLGDSLEYLQIERTEEDIMRSAFVPENNKSSMKLKFPLFE